MRDEFIGAADAERHPDYEAFLRDKIDRARMKIGEGRHVSNETLEAEFAELRDAARRKIVLQS